MASPLHKGSLPPNNLSNKKGTTAMSTITETFVSLSSTDLATVSGGEGASSFESFADKERASIAPAYRQIVCTTAGIKGGPSSRGRVWPGRVGRHKIRAAEILKSYCIGGSTLPAAAPKSPF